MNYALKKFLINQDENALHPAIRNIRIDCVDLISGISIQVAEHVDGEYAQFIVRACNAHAALIHALNCALAELEEWCPGNHDDGLGDIGNACTIEVKQTIRAALKLAEEL